VLQHREDVNFDSSIQTRISEMNNDEFEITSIRSADTDTHSSSQTDARKQSGTDANL
jgi:hypothetical protein